MNKKIWKRCCCFLVTAMLLFGSALPVHAEEAWQPADSSRAIGYYVGDRMSLVIMGNNSLFLINEFGTMQSPPCSFQNNNSDFLVCFNGKSYLALQKQKKEKKEDGGEYYALFPDYIGSNDTVDYDEGRQVQFGDQIFDNDYEVVVKYPLANFFGAQYTGAGAIERFEGPGFDSPEAAIDAYASGLKQKDLDAMIASFAVETYVDHFDPVKQIERFNSQWMDNMCFGLIGGVAISGTMQESLSIYNRVGAIVSTAQYHHARLNNSLAFYGTGQNRIYKLEDLGDTVEEMIAAISPLDTDSVYDKMVLGETLSFEQLCVLIDKLIERDFGSDENLAAIQKQYMATGAEDCTVLAKVISINDQRFLLTGTAGNYHGRWYLIDIGGYLANYLNASPYSYGMMPVGDTEYSEHFNSIPEEALDAALAVGK